MAEDLNQRKKDLDDIKKKIDDIEKNQANYDKRTNDNLRLKAKYQREVNRLREEEANLAEEIANSEKASTSSVKELNKLAAKNVRLAKTKAAIILRSIGLESKSPDFIKKATLATAENIEQGYTALEKLRQEAIETFQTDPEAFNLEEFQSRIEEIKNNIDMSKKGADELAASVDAINTQFEGAADSVEDIKAMLDSELPFFDSLDDIQKKIEDFSTILGSPQALVAAGLGLLVKLGKDAFEAIKGVRTELGTSVIDSAKLAMNMKLASVQATLLGGNGEEAANAIKSLAEFTGRVDNLSATASQNFGRLAAFTGASAESLAKTLELTSLASGFTKDRALDELLALEALTDSEGVLSSQVFEDVADSAENSALFFGKTADEIGKAAIEMRKLGVGASALERISESILDLETSIGNEFQVQLLLGNGINLNRARQLAFDRDAVGLAEEIKRQLSGQFELNKLNFAQVKAITDFIGLSQVEIQKLIQGQDIFNEKASLSSRIFDFLKQNIISVGIVAGGLVGLLGSIGAAILSGFGLVTLAAASIKASLGAILKTTLGGAAIGGSLGAITSQFMDEPRMENFEVTRKGVLDDQGIGVNASLGDNVFLAADKRTQVEFNKFAEKIVKKLDVVQGEINKGTTTTSQGLSSIAGESRKTNQAIGNIQRS